MNEIPGELLDVRDLTTTEISTISGGFNNMGPLMAAGSQVLRLIDDINLKFYGCFEEGGKTTCVYSYDL